MSDTATAETEQTEAEPQEDLKAQTSASILERRDALASEATAALDGDDWSEYEKLASAERVLTEELDRRHSVKTPVPAPEKIPFPASERMDALRAEIAVGEAELAKFSGVTSRGTAPPKWGETPEDADAPLEAKAQAFTDLERKKQDLAALERRLQFAENSDDDITTSVEDAQIEHEDLMKALQKARAEHRPAGRMSGATAAPSSLPLTFRDGLPLPQIREADIVILPAS